MGTRFNMTIIQMLCTVFSVPEKEMKELFTHQWCCLSSLAAPLQTKSAVRLGLDTQSRLTPVNRARVKTLCLKPKPNEAAAV